MSQIMSFKNIFSKLPLSWQAHFYTEYEKPYFQNLLTFLDFECKHYTIFPPIDLWFQAFYACCFNNLSVVILGQDPYHNEGQANGLCFSVNNDIIIPPSLKNIFKEVNNDLNISIIKTGNLTPWAEQGVLLLNAILTVRSHQAGSHQNYGWEVFTDSIIKKISDDKKNIVFLLWGAYAQKKIPLIDMSKHYILTSAHPSPLSAHRGFFGNQHFSKTNDYLKSVHKIPIEWQIMENEIKICT